MSMDYQRTQAERSTVDELVELDPNLYVDERGVVRMREMREYVPVNSIGGEIAWPDVVVCVPRWTGRDARREEREYVPIERVDVLREIICDLWPRAAFTMSEPNVQSWQERLHDAGIDVEYDGGGY